MNKICTFCQIEQDISQFGIKKRKIRNSDNKNYISIYCKKCEALKSKLWRQRNLEKVKTQNNSLTHKGSRKIWLINNNDKKKKYKRHSDPIFKLRDNISNAVLKALKRGKSSKAGRSVLKYLNYTIIDLKVHLESHFDINMTWDNHGIYWHIDHIIPQSDLPYTNMSD